MRWPMARKQYQGAEKGWYPRVRGAKWYLWWGEQQHGGLWVGWHHGMDKPGCWEVRLQGKKLKSAEKKSKRLPSVQMHFHYELKNNCDLTQDSPEQSHRAYDFIILLLPFTMKSQTQQSGDTVSLGFKLINIKVFFFKSFMKGPKALWLIGDLTKL